jgi:hypothetical protein
VTNSLLRAFVNFGQKELIASAQGVLNVTEFVTLHKLRNYRGTVAARALKMLPFTRPDIQEFKKIMKKIIRRFSILKSFCQKRTSYGCKFKERLMQVIASV